MLYYIVHTTQGNTSEIFIVSRLNTRLLKPDIPSGHLLYHFWMLDVQVCSTRTRKSNWYKINKFFFNDDLNSKYSCLNSFISTTFDWMSQSTVHY